MSSRFSPKISECSIMYLECLLWSCVRMKEPMSCRSAAISRRRRGLQCDSLWALLSSSPSSSLSESKNVRHMCLTCWACFSSPWYFLRRASALARICE